MSLNRVPIGEFATLAVRPKCADSDPPVLSISKYDGFVRSDEYFKKKVHSEDTSKYKLVTPGDFAFSPIHLDEGSIALANESGLISPMYKVFEVDEKKVHRRYLIRMLKCPKMVQIYGLLGDGSVHRRRSVPFDRLASVEIPLPSLEKQRAVAAILDQADAILAANRRALESLNLLSDAIFHETFGDPATNPKKFKACELKDIIKFIGGSQPPKSNFSYEPGPDLIRLVQIRDFRSDDYITYVPKELAKRPFDKDDVLIGRYGPPVFQILRGLTGTYNVALMKAQPIGEVTKDFIFYLLREKRLHSYVVANSERTAGQSGVNLQLLNSYPAFFPPKELLDEFSKRVRHVEKLQGIRREAIQSAERLFSSLQGHAFQGEL